MYLAEGKQNDNTHSIRDVEQCTKKNLPLTSLCVFSSGPAHKLRYVCKVMWHRHGLVYSRRYFSLFTFLFYSGRAKTFHTFQKWDFQVVHTPTYHVLYLFCKWEAGDLSHQRSCLDFVTSLIHMNIVSLLILKWDAWWVVSGIHVAAPSSSSLMSRTDKCKKKKDIECTHVWET